MNVYTVILIAMIMSNYVTLQAILGDEVILIRSHSESVMKNNKSNNITISIDNKNDE